MLTMIENTYLKHELAKHSVRLDLGFILALRTAFECVDKVTVQEGGNSYDGQKREKEEKQMDERFEQQIDREYP